MTEQEYIDTIARLQEEMRDMINDCEIQERSLNLEEKNNFEIKEKKVKELDTQLNELQERSISTQNKTEKNVKNNMKSFKQTVAEAMSAIANNRSTEDYTIVAGNRIELRAVENTTSTEVDAVRGEVQTELIEPLQKALLLDKLGIKIINTSKAVVMPSVNAVEATIEGETTALVGKKLNFAKTKVAPFRIGLSLPFSNTAIKEADINLVSYAIDLAGKAEAQLINKVAFNKTAITGATKGCFVDAYATPAITMASGKTPSYSDIVKLASKVKGADVNIDETAAYVISPEMEATLKVTPMDAGSGRFVLEGNTMNGYPVLVSNHVEGYVGFGVFSNFLIQKVGIADMIVDNMSRSKENITEVNFNDNIAVQVIRTEAFAAIKLA